LVNFTGTNGETPFSSLIIDAAGDLFGTTAYGGAYGDGTVFEIPYINGNYASTPATLFTFNGTDGAYPTAGLLTDTAGDLFGTTQAGGTNGDGTVFELTSAGFQSQVTCYRCGTRIATPTGERTVESLEAGDLVQTDAGDTRSITWTGHRKVDCRRHPKPERVWPARVSAGAFGPGLPRRDLWLSPDHAVYVNEVLIPIKHLINGTTIAQVPMDEVTYYHVELPQHDLLLAEGLPAESYLDTGDRSNFENGGKVMWLFPDFSAPTLDTAMLWETKACAPLIVRGPELEAARAFVNAQTLASAAAAVAA